MGDQSGHMVAANEIHMGGKLHMSFQWADELTDGNQANRSRPRVAFDIYSRADKLQPSRLQLSAQSTRTADILGAKTVQSN